MASSSELLRLAADALDDSMDPFSPAFLGEHDMMSGQCAALGRQLAIGARMVAQAIERPKSHEGIAMLMTMTRELA